MTQEVYDRRMKWAAALKSGEYEQGTGRLRTRSGKYCCLGVACALYGNATGRGAFENEAGTYIIDNLQIKDGLIPPLVAEFYDIDIVPKMASVSYGYQTARLDNLNDSGTTFEEIADLIIKATQKEWDKQQSA